MKWFHMKSMVMALATALVFGFTGPIATFAATNPSLGTASTYSILAGQTVTNTGATTVSGDVGIYPGAGAAPNVTNWGSVTLGGTLHDIDAAAHTAMDDKNLAYTALDTNVCGAGGGIDYGGVVKSLNGLTLPPGVYCASEFDLSGTLTLNGTASDVWIFKSTSSLVISSGVAAKVVFTGGGQPCNVWWRVMSTASFDANSTLAGNILADTSITFAAGSSLNGRALARSGSVTLSSASITGPTCATAAATTPTGATTNNYNTLTVVKQVINDSGGTATYTNFPLFINGNPTGSGQSQRLAPGIYTVTETNLPGYVRTFTGSCDASGKVNLGGYNTQDSVCTVVNNDVGTPTVALVPPLIDVVKVPNPLALPAGPGSVTYTYTVKNAGTVPMTDVTLVGDTCSPITITSGDTNGDSKLDVDETWVYHCTKTLSQTTKNTVTATGHANGLTAVDIASATVVVGSPIVPPLIHVTKIPDPLTLPGGAGAVTYTEKVTNPGTVALNNVSVKDDKCIETNFISGDTNGDSKLDPSETWTYTCRTRLTKTTTNTAIATGSANGLTATDFALATVVVAIPKLPNTGVAPSDVPWNIIIPVGIFAASLLLYAISKKQTV